MMQQTPNVVELFAGAGGLSVGLQRAGFSIAVANEIEPDFAATFRLNHPETLVLNSDIYELDLAKELAGAGISRVTLVSGGPPCQGFSTVGSKNPLDRRNSLFHEYLRVVTEIDPPYILFENVAGFRRMYNGVAHGTLLRELQGLGYAVVSGILEASDYGLPQKRQRTIIVGWKTTLPPVALPQPTHSDGVSLFGLPQKMPLIDAISDLPQIDAGTSAHEYLCAPRNAYQKKMRGDCQVLTEHNASNYGEKMKKILALIPSGGSVEDLPLALRPKSYFKNTYARLLADAPAPTITRNFGTPSSSRCIHPFQNRALSTREGARLQGFPDAYQFVGSKTSKNLQIGNAVPPVFGEILAGQIMQSILLATSGTQKSCHGAAPLSASDFSNRAAVL